MTKFTYIDEKGKRFDMVLPTRKDLGINGESAVDYRMGDLLFRISFYGYPKAEVFKLIPEQKEYICPFCGCVAHKEGCDYCGEYWGEGFVCDRCGIEKTIDDIDPYDPFYERVSVPTPLKEEVELILICKNCRGKK